MTYLTIHSEGAECRLALFLSPEGRGEAHAIIRSTLPGETFQRQLECVREAAGTLADKVKDLTGRAMAPVFRRYFLSDPTNQAPLIEPSADCAQSIVGQSPLDGTKVAEWVWLQEEGKCENLGDGLWRNGSSQLWQGDCSEAQPGDSYMLTEKALDRMDKALEELGGSLADHCMRTWFVVRDVDSNYKGVVAARNDVFDRIGLAYDTHFIASTGIGGFSPEPRQTVAFNAFADLRLEEDDITYLKGSTHLNPTAEYGVAFERATATDYADRREVFVSGTASIDNRGCIVAPGDIEAQTDRMLENIGVLLAEGGCGFEDVAHLIVYLRDAADHAVVERIFAERLPEVPRVIVLAPVCRPGWLIETECMAVKGMKTGSKVKY